MTPTPDQVIALLERIAVALERQAEAYEQSFEIWLRSDARLARMEQDREDAKLGRGGA